MSNPSVYIGNVTPDAYMMADKVAKKLGYQDFAVVDFSKPNTSKRYYQYKNGKLIFNTYVASGSGSGVGTNKLKFSNIPNSRMSSLGFMKTGESYVGKHGQSIKLDGLEPGINDNVRDRAIVVHTSAYAGKPGGYSWGCFALPLDDGKDVINYMKHNKVLIFSYYPDNNYIKNSKLINGD